MTNTISAIVFFRTDVIPHQDRYSMAARAEILESGCEILRDRFPEAKFGTRLVSSCALQISVDKDQAERIERYLAENSLGELFRDGRVLRGAGTRGR